MASRVGVCCFSSLPIENNEEVLYMVVRRREDMWNQPLYPFAAFYPVTPFVTATYDEDCGFEFDEDQEATLTEYLGRAGYPMPEADYEHEPGNFPFAVKKSVYEFWKTMTYVSYSSGIENRPLSDAVIERNEKLEEYLDLAVSMAPMMVRLASLEPEKNDGMRFQTSVFVAPYFTMAEGERNPAMEGILKAIDAIPVEEVTRERLQEVIAQYNDVYLMWLAMVFLRKVLVPLGTVGPQFSEPANFITYGRFITEAAEADLERQRKEEAEYG